MRELRYRNFRLLIGCIIFAMIGLFFFLGALTGLIDKVYGLFYGLLPVSLILFSISAIMGHKTIGMERVRNRALKEGKCFEAQIADVSHDKSVRVLRTGGNISWNPLIVTVKYIDGSGKTHIEKSKRLYHRLPDDARRLSAKVWVIARKRNSIYIQVFYHENIGGLR